MSKSKMNKREREELANVTEKAERSEKSIEAYLVRKLEELGGLALKYTNDSRTGYPDRLCIMPNGVSFWVELKSKGQRPRAIQIHRAIELRRYGQRVYTADSRETIDIILQNEVQAAQLPRKGDSVD